MTNQKLFKDILLYVLIYTSFLACNKEKVKYHYGTFPVKPVNLSEFNTEFDDYNSALTVQGETFPLCFSSNRNSSGDNYDIVYKLMSIKFSQITGELSVYENIDNGLNVFIENKNINNALTKINTEYDEFGPYLISKGRLKNATATTATGRYEGYIFLYSNNSNGSQDIFYTHNLVNENYENPEPIIFLNTEYNDAYPTFYNNYSEIYFTSDREGCFDIYKIMTNNSVETIESLASDTAVSISEKDTVLSSEFDDKCPFISNNFIVFASNREGGFGGYDLYYSYYINEKWSTPINFGEKINSEYDEYRPVIRQEFFFSNDFMIFSSNRPGGKGGFDLYYVGIDKITD